MIKIYPLDQECNYLGDIELPYEALVGSFIYLHGQLHDKNPGHSDFLAIYADKMPDDDGVYECTVVWGSNNQEPAYLYFWGVGSAHKGRVVAANDEEGRKEALQQLHKRK